MSDTTTTPPPNPTETNIDRTRDLDWLDDSYLDAQDAIADALAEGDDVTASRLATGSGALAVTDAEGWTWQIAPGNRPEPFQPEPDYRFSHRYTKQAEDGRKLLSRRSRFTKSPSLARQYANRIGGAGVLPWLVKHSEPIGYIAAAIVGFGLWLMLGDIVGLLPGVAIVASIAVLAAGLWTANLLLSKVEFREAERLSAILGAAAIGVTAAVPWLATFESDMTIVGRVALCAGVLTAAAAILYVRSRHVFPYFAAIAAFLVTAGAAAYAAVDSTTSGSQSGISLQIGIIAAVIVLFPLTTRLSALRWIPATVILLASAGAVAVLTMDWPTVTNLHLATVALFGFAAAVSAWMSSLTLRRQMRIAHRLGAGALTLAASVVLVANTDWSFLADIPLPIALVATGSMILVVVAGAIRIAVRRLKKAPAPSA